MPAREHGVSVDELTPRMFSFNNPYGACPTCTGMGIFMKVDPDLVIPDKSKSIRGGAIKASGWGNADGGTISQMYFEGLAAHYGFSLDTPVKDLPKNVLDVIFYGTKGEKIKMTRVSEYGSGTYYATFEGILNNLERRYRETNSSWAKEEIEGFMSARPCPDCHGQRCVGASCGNGRRSQHPRALLHVGEQCAGLYPQPEINRPGANDRPSDYQGNL